MMKCAPSTSAGKAAQQSIYRVPEWAKNTNNTKAYQPQVMALGPFHHGAPNLVPMEEHKVRAVVRRLTKSRKTAQAYKDAINGVAERLLAAYGKDPRKEWPAANNRKSFVEMMVRDGCFLLELISLGLTPPPDDDGGDLFFNAHNYMYMRGAIISDVLAMENQLPMLLLQTLLRVDYGTTPNAHTDGDVGVEDQTDEKINLRMLRFLGRQWRPEWVRPLGLHPLHLYHSSLTYGGPGEPEGQGSMEEIMPSAVEIHEAGVHFHKSETDSLLDVHFKHGGMLSMPALMVDDTFEGIFLNLLAFEHLHAPAGNTVTAYVFFMDNIIDTAEDVSLLKAKGIFNNYLGSDDALAKLINDTLSKGVVMSPCSVINKVQHEVKKHCKKPWNKWRANFMHTYLRNPWVFISLVAASILLLATVLQTGYTVAAFYQASATRSPDIN
ncbi:UPF0481 protein At3g47200 [Triticum aestivum]|nr:UPF0481 protein At3g47200-like [Triticum aestivum]